MSGITKEPPYAGVPQFKGVDTPPDNYMLCLVIIKKSPKQIRAQYRHGSFYRCIGATLSSDFADTIPMDQILFWAKLPGASHVYIH